MNELSSASTRPAFVFRPKVTKPITSELGNVSPIIVVPGPWSQADLDFHGANLASMLTNNGGFNCNATRVIVQHASWPQRRALIEATRAAFRGARPRFAYYPGAAERQKNEFSGLSVFGHLSRLRNFSISAKVTSPP